MKNFFNVLQVLALVLLAGNLFGQGQRVVLVEEFTQASCPPCAAQNPVFNTLLDANPTKLVAIKYQTSWPGVDPMNAQNPSDVQTRVTYYNVTGVPTATVDAVQEAGSYYTGAPHNVTQAMINAEYAVTSPLDIQLTHSFSAAYDSIHVTMTITALSATTGTLVAQVGVTENQIQFATAPGTNGETVFHDVMRKMLPSAAGTTLPGTWTVGQTQTLHFAWKLANIYNINEVGVVAWVQNNANKNVLQAVYSTPVVVPNSLDAGVALNGAAATVCASTIQPSVTINNASGSAALTSCDISYKYDNGTPQVQHWTGNIAVGGSASVSLPVSNTLAHGGHTLTVTCSNTNGLDISTINNQASTPFYVSTSPTTNAVVEGFVSTVFPPANFMVTDGDANGTWTRVNTCGGFGTSANATKIDYYNVATGDDDLFLPTENMTGAVAPVITFDVAHQQYSTTLNDQLQLMASTDCGATWTSIYNKAGAALSTATGVLTTAFTPTATQWRTENVSLAQYVGQTDLFLKFEGTSAYGNNIYLDNINIQHNASGVNDVPAADGLSLFPNPTNDNINAQFTLTDSKDVNIEIVNTLGQVVKHVSNGTMAQGQHTLTINTLELPAGTYFFNIVSNEKVSTQRFVVLK